jgi:hypothetical protein
LISSPRQPVQGRRKPSLHLSASLPGYAWPVEADGW